MGFLVESSHRSGIAIFSHERHTVEEGKRIIHAHMGFVGSGCEMTVCKCATIASPALRSALFDENGEVRFLMSCSRLPAQHNPTATP